MELHGGKMSFCTAETEKSNIMILELPVYFNNDTGELRGVLESPAFVSIFSATPRTARYSNPINRRAVSMSMYQTGMRLHPSYRSGNSVRVYSEHEENNSETEMSVRTENPKNNVSTKEGSRVLVVDDDCLNRKMLCRLLESHCGVIVTAEDGALAVKEVIAAQTAGTPFDLVLMDYQMPVMDGPSAARVIREEGYAGPIIGVTGNTLPIHIATFMKNGADDVLAKPLRFDMLMLSMTGLGKNDIFKNIDSNK